MKVILTERVKTLGNVGEIVNVSEGHARNYLIPNSLAMLADESNKKQMEDHKKMLSKKVEEQKKEAKELAKKLSGLKINIIKKVGGNGRLFGTVTNTEISKELSNAGIDIERRMIHIEDSIKSLGEYEISAKLFSDVEAKFKVNIEIDPKQAAELKKKQEEAERKKAAKKAKKDEEPADNADSETTDNEETEQEA